MLTPAPPEDGYFPEGHCQDEHHGGVGWGAGGLGLKDLLKQGALQQGARSGGRTPQGPTPAPAPGVSAAPFAPSPSSQNLGGGSTDMPSPLQPNFTPD